MDESIYNYIDYIRHDVSKSVIDVLYCLGRSSLRCIGLSFMKQATIAKETGYTRKTVTKAIKRLEALGVVDSVRTKTKKDGRPSVKIIRILPFSLERLQQAVTSTEGDGANGDDGLTTIDEFEPLLKESFPNNYREDNEGFTFHDNENDKDPIESISIDELDSSFVPTNIVVKEFVQAAKPFFKAGRIYCLWGIVKNAVKQAGVQLTEEVIEATIEAFKSSVFMEKAGRIKKTFDGYFFGVLSAKFAPIKRREVAETNGDSILFYDWVNE